MEYTYEIVQTDGSNIVVYIYKDNLLMIHQPFHPQQNFETDGSTWKDVESATAWAEKTISEYNQNVEIEMNVSKETPTKEDTINVVKEHLASLMGVSVEKIGVVETPSEE